MRSLNILFVLLVFMLPLPFNTICSQTHLKLILKTDQPIDSAFIGHFTNKEFSRIPYKDTIELDFKINKTDFYHVNYWKNKTIYNAKLFLDTGSITVYMKIENGKLVVDEVKGSPTANRVKIWKMKYAEVLQKKDSVMLDFFLLKTYEEHIESMFSFNIGEKYLDIHQNNKLKLYALLPLIERQGDELRTHFGFSFLNERLQGILKNNIITLSDFEFIDPENRTVHIASMNDLMILDFWFVGCIPCMEDHARIKTLLPFLKQKNTALISISNDDSYGKWKDYLAKHNYSWLQYKRPSGNENIVSQLGISTYPTYILLSKTGEIIYSTYLLDEVIKQLH
ncbi:MAG: thioredoxin family protein [Ferruginibacter sp.]